MRPSALILLAGVAVLAAGSAVAQQKGGGGLGNSRDPIDISANAQEVFQSEHRVVYRGEVEALQGQQRLRTPQLTLYFAQREGQPKAATGGSLGSGFGSIQRMEAEGPVYLVTPTQAATGDRGVYDAASDTITLTGKVVLKQDKNVATGDKLVIDQKTGHATLSSGPSTRVRGVFYSEGAAKPAAPAPGR